MTTHMKILGAVIALLTIVLPVVSASEPNDVRGSIRFELQAEALGPFSAKRVLQSGGPTTAPFVRQKPTYAAGVPREGSYRFLANVGTPYVGQFIRFAMEHGGLSAAQNKFLQTTKGLLEANREGGPAPQWYRPEDEPNSPRQLLLYAVTLEDAKKMAQAYYEYAVDYFNRQIDHLDKLMAEKKARIATAEKRTSEIDRLADTTQKSLDEFQKTVPYRTENEAHEAVGELDRMLNAAQVEIAGIKARIAAIQRYQQQEQQEIRDQARLGSSRLNAMFIEECIALQGAEAREQMATRLRRQANRFLDLKSTLASAATEKQTLTETLHADQMNLAVMEDQMKSAREEQPSIPDTIAIYPVGWVDNGQGD